MSLASRTSAPIRHADRFYIGGQWAAPSSDATIDVIDPGTEELFFSVAEARAADIGRATGAAREAVDDGPWPRLTHAQRAEYLRALAAEVRRRSEDVGQIWPRESGVLHDIAQGAAADAAGTFDYYAELAGTGAGQTSETVATGMARRSL
jgi:aldehyde dehydrogenase (NAD+)